MKGWIRARTCLNGWSWSIHVRADDHSWNGVINRNDSYGRQFATKENAERKARAVAKQLNIKLDPLTP